VERLVDDGRTAVGREKPGRTDRQTDGLHVVGGCGRGQTSGARGEMDTKSTLIRRRNCPQPYQPGAVVVAANHATIQIGRRDAAHPARLLFIGVVACCDCLIGASFGDRRLVPWHAVQQTRRCNALSKTVERERPESPVNYRNCTSPLSDEQGAARLVDLCIR